MTSALIDSDTVAVRSMAAAMQIEAKVAAFEERSVASSIGSRPAMPRMHTSDAAAGVASLFTTPRQRSGMHRSEDRRVVKRRAGCISTVLFAT
ncbi:MAG TPA: hypothetical protein PKJ45_03825 [Rubrivivax sp.]|nr:hypothetical protein [Burkholderiales bacterium]HNU10477.1 hypothetical protein [Rubrivivax sp.]